MKALPSNRFLELDALRGIAVILVVCFHLTIGREQANYGFKLGVTGVDLFFTISGFVILLTLEKTYNWKDFVVSRFSRLYPAYWVCVTFTAMLVLMKASLLKEPWKSVVIQYLANMTMFQTYFRVPDIDGPYWTLIVEMLFYFFMLGVFLTKKLEQIELIGYFALLPVIGYHLLLNANPFFHKILGICIPLLNHFPLFLSGIIFYKIKFDKSTFIRYFTISLCFFLQYILFVDGGKSKYFISHLEYGFMLAFYLILFILYVNNTLHFIVNKITVFLGNISYSLYLVHQFISIQIIIILTKHAHFNFWLAAFGIALPTVVIISILINRYVEKPAMNFIRSNYKKKVSKFMTGSESR